MVPDRDGSLVLRQGSDKLYTGLGSGTGSVHSLYTAELENGTTYRIIGADDTIAVNGSQEVTSVAGSGDLAIGDDAYQFFMARSTTKKKMSPSKVVSGETDINEWSMEAPIGKVTLEAETAITSTVAAFNNSESPAVTVQEGSGAIGGENDKGGNANEATKLTPDGTTYRGVLQRLFASDQNFLDISNITGTDTDLIDFYIKLENPRNVESIKVEFGIGDSSTVPFEDDRFEFEFNIKDGIDIPIKDLESESHAAFQAAVINSLSAVSPAEISGSSTPEGVQNTLANVGEVPAPKSGAPADNVWSHLTITRGQFKRIGSTATRGWDTVRGFKIVYKTLKGKTSALTIADAIVVGGGDRSLTGQYRCVIRAVRQVTDTAGNVVYYEKSPPSEQSEPIQLNHQTLKITIPSATYLALDSQADQIWVYLFGGWLDSYYRFAVIPAQPNTGMSIDELTTPSGSAFNTAVKRMRIPSWGFTYTQTGIGTFTISAGNLTSSGTTATCVTDTAHGYTTGQSVWVRDANEAAYNGVFTITVSDTTTFTYTMGSDPVDTATGTIIIHNETPLGNGAVTASPTTALVLTLRTSELEALTDNNRIEPYQQGCPDNVMDIAGPWNGRMFVLTSEGYVYPSNINDPSSFNSYQVIDLTRYGDPYWIAKTGNGIYVGMDADVIFLQGDGANSVDLAQINLYGNPLNIGNPPIDEMHWVDGNSITYRSNDGLMMLTGASVEHMPLAGTSLLWRGQERHDIQLDLDGRFRCVIDNHMLYLQAAEEGQSNAIWRFSPQHGQWSRLSFGQVTTWKSIFNEPDGTLIAGDASGQVWELEKVDVQQDDANDIPVELRTPISDGGEPLNYKDPMDLQIHMDSGNANGTVRIYKDGDGDDANADTYTTASTSQPEIWRQQLDSLGKFIKASIKFTGSFGNLRVHSFNITYRARPQRMVRLDCGYLLPQGNQDLIWAQEVEFDVNAASNFTMKVYRNDTEYTEAQYTVTATAGKRDVYRIPVPRETKAERLRIVFESSTDEGEGDVGFDPYFVRVRTRSTGNEDFTRQYQTLYPAGQAS
jgi:hypothetical protein